jgi:hypothetical protein
MASITISNDRPFFALPIAERTLREEEKRPSASIAQGVRASDVCILLITRTRPTRLIERDRFNKDTWLVPESARPTSDLYSLRCGAFKTAFVRKQILLRSQSTRESR